MTMDPKREKLIRHILEARKLARELDAQVVEFMLENAMSEAMEHATRDQIETIRRISDGEERLQ